MWDFISKLDFLKKEKKPTRQAAQKHLSRASYRLRCRNISRKISRVMGNFCEGLSPFTLLTPFRMEVTYQLFSSGFFKPASKCNNLTTLRYCLTELKDSLLDRNAMYLPRSVWEMGTGLISNWSQNDKYDVS